MRLNIPKQIGSHHGCILLHAVPNNDVPVTIQLGFPIVDMPGCVEAHPDNKINRTKWITFRS